jgi:hypothetical protein
VFNFFAVHIKIKGVLKMSARKKAYTITVLLIIVASATLITAGCNKQVKFGTDVSSQAITPIENLVAKPADYEKKTVKIEGQIIDECPGGHWFHVKGSKEIIYVTLSGFILPQKVGKIVVVEGSLVNDSGQVALLGKGVEVK